MHLLYLITFSQHSLAVSPKHPDTHWSTEPAWLRCLPEPWGAPARPGIPEKTKGYVTNCSSETTNNIRPRGERKGKTNWSRCFFKKSEPHKENLKRWMGISCVRGTRRTHLGVNPYSTEGTDLKIVTWQATEKKRQTERREHEWAMLSEKKEWCS